MTARAPKKGELVMIYNPDMPDYNKTPYAKEKAAKAKAFIAKHGLPKRSSRKKS